MGVNAGSLRMLAERAVGSPKAGGDVGMGYINEPER